jgi:hypothetical protein
VRKNHFHGGLRPLAPSLGEAIREASHLRPDDQIPIKKHLATTAIGKVKEKVVLDGGLQLAGFEVTPEVDGYEAMHVIRKGQIHRLPKGDVVGQRRFIVSVRATHLFPRRRS